MKSWYKFGCVASLVAVIVDIYAHQILLAILMTGCLYINYKALGGLDGTNK